MGVLPLLFAMVNGCNALLMPYWWDCSAMAVGKK